jgi:RNA polymerase sigma factor (sigma-70 family)
MQDAFLRIFERWDRVSSFDDPEGYLFRAAMNVFRNRYRRAVLALQRTLSLKDAADDLAAVETRDQVVRLLQTLAPRERAAIVLTSILDLSAEEAGRMLGIKASTVRTLSTRARAHMKDQVVDPR